MKAVSDELTNYLNTKKELQSNDLYVLKLYDGDLLLYGL